MPLPGITGRRTGCKDQRLRSAAVNSSAALEFRSDIKAKAAAIAIKGHSKEQRDLQKPPMTAPGDICWVSSRLSQWVIEVNPKSSCGYRFFRKRPIGLTQISLTAPIPTPVAQMYAKVLNAVSYSGVSSSMSPDADLMPFTIQML
jgi:hypothetical protein